MQVHDAKGIARSWVLDQGQHIPGFDGAYFAGSVNWLTDDDRLPPTSDLDINVVIGDGSVPATRYKLIRDGVLLEISELPLDLLRTSEQVLGHFALAGGFRVPGVILDPTGHLTTLQSAVSAEFAAPAWVRRRCEHAVSHALGYLSRHATEEQREQLLAPIVEGGRLLASVGSETAPRGNAPGTYSSELEPDGEGGYWAGIGEVQLRGVPNST